MTIRPAALALAALLAAPMASAEPVDGKAAQGALFNTKGRLVVTSPLPGLPDDMNALLKQALQASAADVRFYGAIAMAPGGGLDSEATALAENFHSSADARAAALASCNARRADDTAPCVIVAQTLPKGYAPRAVELSVDATDAFRKDYRRAKAPKALAISAATGKWAIASGPGAVAAAVEACNSQAADAGAIDCVLAIAD